MNEIKEAKDGPSLSNSELLYLGFDQSSYGNPNIFEEGNKPLDRLERLLLDPDSKIARKTFLQNIRELDRHLGQIDKDTPHFDEVLKNFILEVAVESAHANLTGESLAQYLKFISSLDQQGGLFDHLDETGRGVETISSKILEEPESDRGLMLTRRQLLLMEFVAKTHDLPKLLGGLNAQIDPDHEVIYKEIIGKYLQGKSFVTSSGETLVFDANGLDTGDVDFCVGLASFHEDIWREEAFSKQINSLKIEINPETKENQKTAIERSRMLFHIVDIFGDAIYFDNNQILNIRDNDAFEDRFIDLFRRHINLPIKTNAGIKSENWTRGKVFRPEWGLHGVSGMIWTFEELTSGWGIKVDEDFITKVEQGMIRVLSEAEVAASDVLGGSPNKYFFATKDLSKIPELKNQLLYRHAVIVATRQRLEIEINKRRSK